MENKQSGNGVAGGVVWKFMERISAQLVSFVVSIILARLLAPEYYGAIALVEVFIALANVFVSSGFGTALIQKKDSDDLDFSSVFYGNLVISAVLYAIVFFAAPYVALFYKIEILTPVFRVMGLRIILSSINTIQHAYVSKHMLFKKFFWSTLGGTVVSSIVGIAMAYSGFGIWALVAQYLTNTTIDTVVLFITVNWRPKLMFSFERLKQLLPFGSKLLLSELINTGYLELRSLVIGVQYSSEDLAFYNRGQSFPKLIIKNINTAVSSVMFPAMSKIQDEKERVKELARRSVRICSYVISPLVTGMALVASPMIYVLLGDAWMESVPYLQLYCAFYFFMPMQTASLQIIKAMGESGTYLKLETIKKLIGIGLLIVSMPFGPLAIAIGAVASNIIAVFLNLIPVKRMISYTYTEQIKDIFNGIIPLLAMSGVVIGLSFLPISQLWILVLQVLVGALTYIGVSAITRCDSFVFLLNIVLGFFKKKKKD